MKPIRRLRGSPRPAYLARDERTGRLVYLKLARDRRAAVREVRILRRVASPFTPGLAALHGTADAPWVSMEWIEGRPLGAARERSGPWIADLLRAVSHIHRRGIVHGDLKPANFLRTPEGRIVLVDFEFAGRTGEEIPFGQAGGTPGFVAPERLSGWPADPRSDLFSLAATLRAACADDPALEPVLDSLGAPMPGDRPARVDEALALVAAIAGAGAVPAPDLRFAGWANGARDVEDLAAGLASYLGCDAATSHRLAAALLDGSGGGRREAQEIWRAWLPRVTQDPWGPVSAEAILAALPAMREEAKRVARAWIAALPEPQRTRAGRLALLGRGFSEIDREGLPAADEPAGDPGPLVREGMLRRVPTAEGAESGWRFASEPLWSAALDTVDPGEARRIHRFLAERMEAAGAGEPSPALERAGSLAWHLEQGGERERARAISIQAALRAFARGRSEEAVSFFNDAWRWSGVAENPEPAEIVRALLSPDFPPAPQEELFRWLDTYGTALAYANRWKEAETWISALGRLARDEGQMVAFHRCMADACLRGRRTEEQLRHVEQGLALVRDDPGAEGRLRLLQAQALIADTNRIEEGMAAAERACDLLARAGDRRYRSIAKSVLSVALYHRSRFAEARDRLHEALAIGIEADLPFQQAQVHTNLTAVEDVLGNHPAALAHMAAALDLSREHGFKNLEFTCALNLARMSYEDTDGETCLRHADRARRVALELQNRPNTIRAMGEMAQILVRQGHYPRAERLCREALAITGPDDRGIEVLRLKLLILRIHTFFRGVRVDPAFIRELDELAHREGNAFHKSDYQIACALNSLHDGRPEADVLRIIGDRPSGGYRAVWHDLALGRIAHFFGREGEAAEHASSALRATEGPRPDPYLVSLALLDLARYRFALGQADAREAALESVGNARKCGARWVEAQALLLNARMERGEGRGETT